MLNLPVLVNGVLAVSVLYRATVTITALAAVFAQSPGRRRDAQSVLKILLRRRSR